MTMAFGIEHEVAFLRPDGQFADFTNTTFEEFAQIIQRLPIYPGDYPQLHVGDVGIRKKRWYIEGVERFSETGELIGFAPKGIEIRTTIHFTIQGAIAELTESFQQLRDVAAQFGFTPFAVAFNPYQTAFEYDPPLNSYEQQLRNDEPEYQTEHLPMVTYGPDFNLSIAGLPIEHAIDVGRKLTFYSPAIVPFSFNAPFYAGTVWAGASARTAMRTGARPSVRVYVEHERNLYRASRY
jgi:gamma-glutamyl:cysteine ligase YbdK (ATP-grasp superfamily)